MKGEVFNSTEKPPVTSFVMAKNMIGPEGNVFVCGAGAGGDVIGFILAKMQSSGSAMVAFMLLTMIPNSLMPSSCECSNSLSTRVILSQRSNTI